jgi:LPXTG-motif cell wall-anchored protein
VKKLVFAITVAGTSFTGLAGVASAQEYPPDTTVAVAPPTTQVAAQPPTVGLPATGSDVSDVLRIGALLATGGLIFVGIARRRSHNSSASS